MASNLTRRLKEFDSNVPIPLETRGPGTYEFDFLIEGNSLLSTIFIAAIDVGASVLVSYVDYTTGLEEGEEFALNEHPTLTATGVSRITVTRIHNKPRVRAVVSGGNVRFSVYITVVSSFASDLDAALQYEGDLVNLDRDKGMPIAAYETTNDEWSFLRTYNGRLQVDVPGVLQTSQQVINLRLYGASFPASKGFTYTHINYIVPTGKKFYWTAGNGSANSWTKWIVEIDGVFWLTKRNAFDQPDVILALGQPLILTAGQNIIVTAENRSPFNNSEIETWIFGSLEDI